MYILNLTLELLCFRLAKLSEGQLIDGRLECLYHGWQFEGEGKCVKIPQVCLVYLVPNICSIKCPFLYTFPKY